MAKIRYQYNTNSLKIEKVQVTMKERIKRIASSMAFGLVFGVVVIVLAYNFMRSPREKVLLNELEQYKLQYKIMNDRMDKVQKVLADVQDRDDNIYRVIFEAEPIPSEVRKAGFGGVDRYEHLEGLANSKIIVNTAKRLDEITSQLVVQSKSYDAVFKLAAQPFTRHQLLPRLLGQVGDNQDIFLNQSVDQVFQHPDTGQDVTSRFLHARDHQVFRYFAELSLCFKGCRQW